MLTLEEYIKQLQTVPGTNTNSNYTVRQAVQQPRKELKVKQQARKTSTDRSWRNVQKRRKTGKSADDEARERAIREATQPTWRTDVADALHTIGNLSTGAAAIGGLVMAPIPTALAIAGGAAGGVAVDKAVDHFTDSNSWAQWLNRRLGLRDNSMIGQFTNPGMIVGGTIGAKAVPAISKGFKYVWEAIPKGKSAPKIDLSNNIDLSHINLKSPLMTNVSDLRAAITSKDLANRKFFSVEEYGPEPIYTRETVPKKIKVKMAEDDVNPTLNDDITYMNENFDGKTMSTMQVARNRLKLWKESPHGRAINFGGDTDLSTSSWPQTLKFNMNRHLDGTGTAYIPDNYGTTESFLNNAGELPINQETVNYFNTLIQEFNQKTGLNLSKARFVPEKIRTYPDGTPIITKSTGKPAVVPARIYVPNLGLIKHKYGAKIMPN